MVQTASPTTLPPTPRVPREGGDVSQDSTRRRRAGLDPVREAMRLARRRDELQARLDELSRERLESVVELRVLGLSLNEVADLFRVSKGRVQQYEREAHEADPPIAHDRAACPWCVGRGLA